MIELENPAENPCFGCGPLHSRGLHLSFEEQVTTDGIREVLTHFTPQADEIGWPGLFHGGLHYFVLHETSYWAALTLGGKVMQFAGRAEFDQERLPRVGIQHVVRAIVVTREPARWGILATTSTLDGKLCGTLRSHWIPASRERVKRAGIAVPEYLLAEMDP